MIFLKPDPDDPDLKKWIGSDPLIKYFSVYKGDYPATGRSAVLLPGVGGSGADTRQVPLHLSLQGAHHSLQVGKYLPRNFKNHAVCLGLFLRWALCNWSE